MGAVVTATADQKLAELLLIVAQALEDQPAAGATKLNKICFFAEFAHVRATGDPITGAEYRRLPNGPVPSRLVQVRSELVKDHSAEIVREAYLGYIQHRLVARREPDWTLFSDSEQLAIKEALGEYGTKTGTKLSNLSHEEPAWQLFEDGETIPFAMAFAPTSRPGPKARARALELLEQSGSSD
jgi:hypothetical protein